MSIEITTNMNGTKIIRNKYISNLLFLGFLEFFCIVDFTQGSLKRFY